MNSFEKCNNCLNRMTDACSGCVGWNHYIANQFDIHIDQPKFDHIITEALFGRRDRMKQETGLLIKDVIFNYPATVVLWEDGTKTVVKAGDYDIYDPEKGLAMAIAKKALGNQGNYYEVFKEWLPKEMLTVTPESTIHKGKVSISTIKEYCEKHNCTKNKVYGMIKRGELDARKNENGHWVIYEEV